jgi:predicted  nucleic acid-binding Zn-ribbon protein
MSRRNRGGLFNPPNPLGSILAILSVVQAVVNLFDTNGLEVEKHRRQNAILELRQTDYKLKQATQRLNHRRQEAQIDKLRTEVEILQVRSALLQAELSKLQREAEPFRPENYD